VPPELSQGIEGFGVLRECPGSGGLALWQALRDALLWGAVAPESRSALFGAGAVELRRSIITTVDLHPDVAPAVARLADLVEDAAAGDPARVEATCRQIARWAAARGHRGTAVAFAEAAAGASPTSGAAAVEVGTLALQADQQLRAGAWFRRAVALSRREGASAAYAEAHMGLGHWYTDRGNRDRAREHFLKALRRARRTGLHEIRRRASHALFRLAALRGDRNMAERYGRFAVLGLGRGHPEYVAVRQEIASYWIREGRVDLALPLLRGMVKSRLAPADRISTMILLVRAGAAAPDRSGLEDAWQSAVALIDRQGETEHTARQLLELARAALGALEARRIASVAELAAEVAHRWRLDDVAAEAAALLRASDEALQ
jgi:tetratricopeptide (TPR) repeat protein